MVTRNYGKETAYEERPAQVRRREARNKARAKATKRVGKAALVGKQLDHEGYHRTGSLMDVPAKIVSIHANEVRQPPTKARGKARNKY